MTPEQITQALVELRHELESQDNRITAEPIFMVQERVRTTGFDTSYTDNIVWLWQTNDYEEITEQSDPKRFDELEDPWQDRGEAPEGYVRTGYVDRWLNLQPFFTEKAADAYIAKNHHRHGPLRVYVDSAYRNEEWMLIRRLLGGELIAELERLNKDNEKVR